VFVFSIDSSRARSGVRMGWSRGRDGVVGDVGDVGDVVEVAELLVAGVDVIRR
jgi:hypothetical protein